MYVYIYMCVCACMCIRVYVFVYVCVCACVYICIYVNIYIEKWVRMCAYVFVYVYLYACMCICMHMCICMYMYICMCVCVYMCVYFICCCSYLGTMNLTSSLPPLSLIPLIQEETFGVYKEMQNHVNTEEITLEPTPPSKRIYTLPSIKVLFPINQCKSFFLKFTANSIKTYTSQYNKSIIHNLSDDILAKDKLSLLTNGLSFVPTPTKTFKQDRNRS